MINYYKLNLSSIRKSIAHKFVIVGPLCLLFLIFASFGGFLHNHSGDPLHLKPHNTCPASVWYHTPFTIGIAVISILVIRFVLQKVFYFYPRIALEKHFPLSFSRAPPSIIL